MNERDQDFSHKYESPASQDNGEASREEMLGSMLEQTKHYLDEDSCHGMLTDFVREHRLPSRFDFDNLCEVVRCVLGNTSIDKLPLDVEECVTWIATCIYEDPLANERAERLWISIINRMQNES